MNRLEPAITERLEAPFEGCSVFDRQSVGTRRAVYVSGDPDPDRVQVRYWVHDEDQELYGRAYFGEKTQGPPQHVHGGSMAALLDEAMGITAWIAGHPVLAAEITVRFRKSLPLHTVTEFHAWVEEVRGRKIITKGVLLGKNGEIYSESTGLFMVMTKDRLDHMRTLFFEEDGSPQ